MPNAPDLLRKLQIKPPARLALVAAPDGYADRLGRPEGLEVVVLGAPPTGEAFDAVHLFVHTAADIAAFAPAAAAAVRPGGLFWVSYPKRGQGIETDIHRDIGWEPLFAAGWDGVRQVALDGTWSGLRFRPAAEIVRRPKPAGAGARD